MTQTGAYGGRHNPRGVYRRIVTDGAWPAASSDTDALQVVTPQKVTVSSGSVRFVNGGVELEDATDVFFHGVFTSAFDQYFMQTSIGGTSVTTDRFADSATNAVDTSSAAYVFVGHSGTSGTGGDGSNTYLYSARNHGLYVNGLSDRYINFPLSTSHGVFSESLYSSSGSMILYPASITSQGGGSASDSWYMTVSGTTNVISGRVVFYGWTP